MTRSVERSPGVRGAVFLACLIGSPLVGWIIAVAWGARGGLAAGTITALPLVLLAGYAIWHVRRISRTVKVRLTGTRAVPDDPVAERAPDAFRTAGRVVGVLALLLALAARNVGLALTIAIAAVSLGHGFGVAVRHGWLPSPELD